MSTRTLARVDPSRLRSLALAGALVGLLAGLAGATVATITGEPAVDAAIAIEEAAAPADEAAPAEGGHDEASVDRADQRGAGLFAAYALVGAGLGALTAVLAHALRVGRPDVGRRVLLAGAILAGACTLAPWWKYPPNPPAVGDPATLAERQWLYVGVICLALVVGVVAAEVGQRLARAGWAPHRRAVVVAAAVIVPMAVAYAVLPPAPDAIEVPATLVWRFRVASLGANLTMWAVLTFGLAAVAAEAAARRDAPAPPRPVPSPA